MLKQMQQVRFSIHKKLNLANNLYYRKLIIFKNQLVPRQSDAIDCNCYRKFWMNVWCRLTIDERNKLVNWFWIHFLVTKVWASSCLLFYPCVCSLVNPPGLYWLFPLLLLLVDVLVVGLVDIVGVAGGHQRLRHRFFILTPVDVCVSLRGLWRSVLLFCQVFLDRGGTCVFLPCKGWICNFIRLAFYSRPISLQPNNSTINFIYIFFFLFPVIFLLFLFIFILIFSSKLKTPLCFSGESEWSKGD